MPEKKFLANPQKLNPYIYAINNPLKYVDPNGLDVFVAKDMRDNVNKLYKKSKTFRKLFDAARRNHDIMVSVVPREIGDNTPGAADTRYVSKDFGVKKIMVTVKDAGPNAPDYKLGNEFQHVAEIADPNNNIEKPGSKPSDDWPKWVKENGINNGTCTQEAMDAENKVLEESLPNNKEDDLKEEVDVANPKNGRIE